MSEINLRIDTHVLTFDDLIYLDELKLDDLSKIKPRELKNFLARFVIQDGERLPVDEAMKVLGKMPVDEMVQALSRFGTVVKELQATAVTPTTTSG